MERTIINEKTNGWSGCAKIVIKLQSVVYQGKSYYQVTYSAFTQYDVFTYKTLLGAEKKFNKLTRN